MAQQKKQNRPKQPQDPYAQQSKQLGSAVQRLRGWVGSDPTRTPELADALVRLTEHRLLGHAYTVAAPEAQESVKLAAQLLTANGPIGPYTSVDDAARYVTAVVHLAVIQCAAGLPEAGAETVGSLTELREQLGSLALIEALEPATVIWALTTTARGALATGDLAGANAYADAVLQRLSLLRAADRQRSRRRRVRGGGRRPTRLGRAVGGRAGRRGADPPAPGTGDLRPDGRRAAVAGGAAGTGADAAAGRAPVRAVSRPGRSAVVRR